MKRVLPLLLISLLLFVAWASAQKISKPQQKPKPTTVEQEAAIRQGIALHDEKKYDEAIAKYQTVLSENPDSTVALYEMALSYYNKGDKAKAKETAFRGSAYVSDQLPLFYGMIANVLDDEGKPSEAIKLYRDAEKILREYPDMKRHLASVYYNLGVTYFRQKKYAEARAELKEAVKNNFAYASPHFLLAVIFDGTKYKMPGFLAASRSISLEFNTQRSRQAAKIITSMLKPASKDLKTGDITINIDFFAPKDEGDFAMFDLMLGTLTTIKDKQDESKTENQLLIEAIDTLIAILTESKDLKSPFVGKYYVPFVGELKKNGHTEALGNMILHMSNSQNTNAEKWVNDNGQKIDAFMKWAKAYQSSSK